LRLAEPLIPVLGEPSQDHERPLALDGVGVGLGRDGKKHVDVLRREPVPDRFVAREHLRRIHLAQEALPGGRLPDAQAPHETSCTRGVFAGAMALGGDGTGLPMTVSRED
jgi:hypothetical protein